MASRSRIFWVLLVTAAGAAVTLSAACAPPPVEPRPPVIDTFQVTAGNLSAPALVPFAWSVRDPNGDTVTCRIDYQSDGTWDDTITPCPKQGGRNHSAAEGTYVATLEAADATHPPVTTTAAYTVTAGPTEPYNIVATQVTTADPRVTQAIDEAVSRWSAVILRGVPEAVVHADPGGCTDDMPGFDGTVDDIVIDVVVITHPIGVMGDAAPCVNGPDGLPRLSIIRLDAHWVDVLSANGDLGDLIAHEMGHALGIGTTPWGQFMQQDTETGDWTFTGPRAVAEWSKLGGTSPIPLSHTGDHWNETVLQNELMTCYLEVAPAHPLSTLTAAAVGDIGYHVDPGQAEPWALPPEPGYMSC